MLYSSSQCVRQSPSIAVQHTSLTIRHVAEKDEADIFPQAVHCLCSSSKAWVNSSTGMAVAELTLVLWSRLGGVQGYPSGAVGTYTAWQWAVHPALG